MSPTARPGGRDVLVALVVAAIQLGAGQAANQAQIRHGVAEVHSLGALGYGLLLAGPLLLVVRRVYPLSVFVGVLATTLTYLIAGYGYGPIFLSLIVAFLTAATRGSRWRTYPFVPLGYGLMMWPVPALRGYPASGWQLAGVLAWLCVLLALAEGIRQRREISAARQQRLEAARRNEQAQRERERARREQRATEERLAIARELHDVLAHSLSLINVQSSVALELLDRRPEQAATALAAIKQVSRDALGEVHSLLRSIRSGAENGAPTTTPTVGIADLDALIAPARAAGLSVDTRIRGPVRRLPALVDVAAARIVQESLTNVLRHAPGARAVVGVEYSLEELRLTVENGRPTSSPQPSTGGGSGITGMTERAHALGGELSAHPHGDGGFRVSARLPLTTGGTAPGDIPPEPP
ncbi:sensor histidine kinase [Nocardia sp. CDC159]|uniref:histidine kinase n=1 Tax=Nocardia pulmonis TaxID=2951408 RepID=A0A9X2E2Q7_9NOCA|nr:MULTISPECIES: sensor histidine kinase [Nocardia]MCM6772819.1 sensor histidine kinase [Nocardia pulmonis]MCM6785878.1 sensor histidine kinase [Nocardia sp. CDC159]